MKQYSITTDNGTPNAKTHNFVDTVEAGVFVVELTNGVFYIDEDKITIFFKLIKKFD